MNDVPGVFINSDKRDTLLDTLNEASSKANLAALVSIDPHVNTAAKNNILSFITGPQPIDHLFAGVTGSLAALAISRFLQFKKETQILLSLAGFGAGVIISNHLLAQPNKK